MNPMYIHIATAVCLLLFSFVMSTKNWQSAVVFKFIPFVLGFANAVLAVKELGLV